MNDRDEIGEDELQGFVDGRLREARNAAILAYLARHPGQMERILAYAAQRSDLRNRLQEIELPADDPDTLRLQRELAGRLSKPPYRRWIGWAAMVTLLLGAGWWAHALSERYLESPALLAKAAQAHGVFGEDPLRPVELAASAQAEMAAWFSRRLGEQVEIPSLGRLGFTLVGGRLLAGVEGPVAQLLYENGVGERMTLCVAAEPAENGSEIRLLEVDGLTAGYWDEGDLAYALAGGTTERELATIASALGALTPAGIF
jgi:anti-sigma factor RsiW